jgi:hypothetical protein
MNPKLKKVIDDIERTKANIIELQTLLPELERKRMDLENDDIVRLVRSANIPLGEVAEFIESMKLNKQNKRKDGVRVPNNEKPGDGDKESLEFIKEEDSTDEIS